MQQRSEGTRTKIISTAQRLFALEGYTATGVAEICSAAGISKGAFYHHFPSKQAVFLTLLQNWLDGLEKRLAGCLDEGHTVAENLVSMSSMLTEVFQAADGRLPMFLEFWSQASHDPVFWKATVEPYHRYQAIFAALVRKGVQEGSLRPVEPDTAARTILSLAIGILLQGLLDPHGAEWEQVARGSLRVLIEGLGAGA